MDQLLILDAVAFATAAHDGQTRKDADKSPYIRHPIEVAQILSRAGITNPRVLIAALLHDVIEDCGISPETIQKKYGRDVATIVGELTDDPALAKQERKAEQIARASKISKEARLIRVADKIANVRDILYRPPVGWDEGRRTNYLDFARKVVEAADVDNAYLADMIDLLLVAGAPNE